MTAETAIGIDLGTTFSVVAHLDRDGRPWTMPNAEGELKTPSVVFFDPDGVIVGREALKAAEFEPERLAQFVKREMGERLSKNRFAGRQLPPEVIQAFVLKKLREDAELKLESVQSAVITVPAFFNEPRRKATQDAGRLAGLEVLDIINEPTAAAVSYGVQQEFLNDQGESRKTETVLVYDLGGGTFDATLMQIDGHRYRALATAGDVYLGGIDWDERLAEHLALEFYSQCGFNLRTDPVARLRLMRETEEAKHALTARSEVNVHLAHDGNRCRVRVTREKFEELTSDLRERTLFTVRKVLREAKRDWSDVTRLLLVGGSSRMPAVQQLLEHESGLAADRSLSPDEAIAHGAAIYAGLLRKHSAVTVRGMSLKNVNSHDLGVVGVEVATGRKRRQVMIARNTALPAKAEHKFETFKDNQPNVVVNIIEGGDAGGNNATPIGRCLVDNLPEGLPAKTPVIVRFQYAENGRLSVTAHVPSVEREATVTIERTAGLSQDELDLWRQRIIAGMVLNGDEPESETDASGDSLALHTAEDEVPEAADEAAPPPKPAVSKSTRPPEKPARPAKRPVVSESKPVAKKPIPETPPATLPPASPPPETGDDAPSETERESDESPLPVVVPVTVTNSDTSSQAVAPIIEPDEDPPAPAPAHPPITDEPLLITEFLPLVDDAPTPLVSTESVAVAIDEDEEDAPAATRITRQRQLAVFGASTLLHLIALLVLALIMLPDEYTGIVFDVLSSAPKVEEKKPELIEIKEPEEVNKKEEVTQTPKKLLDISKKRAEIDVDDFEPKAVKQDLADSNRPVSVAPQGGEFSGRSSAGRAALVARYGGTKASEGAVQAGLEWLKRHQNSDGSWSFDHTRAACKGQCTHPGKFKKSYMGATALALMAFLGSGNTYSQGDFQKTVEAALVYIFNNGKSTKNGGDFRGTYDGNGGMYIQGLVAIALCEALAMSEAELGGRGKGRKRIPQSRRLKLYRIIRQHKAAAQGAIQFIIYAQSKNGGWKYNPRSGADTSVVGWQVMALASAFSAKLGKFPGVARGASGYLDTVQAEGGAKYGYTSPSSKPSTTAVGLLCRIYLGWRRGHPPLRYGVMYLSKMGPSRSNMYYNYYATQVMHQYGGLMWKKWNAVMRDQLVNSQVKKGHAAGSWNVTDPHAGAGGRLYQTCLSVMTLEVYYRHLPLYKQLNDDPDGEEGLAGKAATKKKPGKSKKPKRLPNINNRSLMPDVDQDILSRPSRARR